MRIMGKMLTLETRLHNLNWHHKLPETSQPCSPALCFQYDLMSGSLNHQQTSFLIFLKETAELLLAVLNLHLGFSFSFQSQQGRTKMMCRIDSDQKAVDFRKRLIDEETQGQWHRPRPLNKARAKLSRKGETRLQLSSCQTHTHTHTHTAVIKH